MLRTIIAFITALGMSAAIADVSGNWTFNVEIPGAGSGSANVTMDEAEDGTITGQYSGQLGNTAITGQAEGDSFSFDVNTQMGTVTYEGELQDDGTLAGTLDLGGMAEGEFTATKQ